MCEVNFIFVSFTLREKNKTKKSLPVHSYFYLRKNI